MENRRKHPRARENLIVKVTVLESTENNLPAGLEYECHTRDVSFQGMCIFSDVIMAPGTKIGLQIKVGDPAECYFMDGIVIWCSHDYEFDTYQTGIQLLLEDEIQNGWRTSVVNLLSNVK